MNVGDVVRTILMRFTTDGAPQAAAALDRVKSAHEGVAKSAAHSAQVTETSAKHQLSMAQSLDRLERRFNQTARAQFEYEKVQRQVNAAVAQNPALQARANDVLARAAAHYGAASAAQSSFGRGMNVVSNQASVMAGRLGGAGSMLVGLGPAGIAAGVAIGAIALGLGVVVKSVNDLAERSGKLVDFAETTGLAATSLQALNKAGAEVGLNQEKVGTIVERFTTQLADLRNGEGELFKQLNANNSELVVQLASTNDVAKAWDIMSRAVAGATDQIERNRLVAAIAGRRNIGAGRLLTATDQAGGIGGLTDRAGSILPDDALRRWDELGDRIAITSQQARNAYASIFADAILSAQLKFHETNLAIAQGARDFTLSDDFKLYIKVLTAPVSGAVSAFFDPAQFFRPPAPAPKVGTDDARGANTEAEQASIVLTRQLLAEQNKLTDQFNLQMQAITARTQEERVALAIEQRRVELAKTNTSDAKLAEELQRTGTLAVARFAAGHRDAMVSMSGQLAVAQAVTAQERMAAQQLVTYNQLRLEGRNHEQASLEALTQRQITQAQINSNAEGQLAGLEDQHRIITATSEMEKMRAQEAARYNDLVRQGVDSGLAAQIAAQERLNAESAINAQLEKQAAAFRKATYEASQLSIELEQIAASANSFLGGSGSFLSGKPSKGGGFDVGPTQQTRAETFFEQTFGKGGADVELGPQGFGRRGTTPGLLKSVVVNEQGLRNVVDEILGKGGSLQEAIAEINKQSSSRGIQTVAPGAAFGVLQELYDLLSKEQGGSTAAQEQSLEQQIAFLESQPRSIERDRAMFNLIDELKNLRESTEALNTTIGLDPLFSQGHGYVGIGYNPHGGRSPRIPIDPSTEPFMPALAAPGGATGPVLNTLPVSGSMTSPGRQLIDPRTGRPIFGMADGGMFMVGGSGGVDSQQINLAMTPGELINVTPPRELQHYGQEKRPTQNVTNVTNNFNFPPSRNYGDRRSQRHLTEGFGRAMAQAR